VGHRLHDLADRRHATDPVEIPFRPEPVENDRRIDPLPTVMKVEQMAKEDLVGFVGEILRAEDERDIVAGVRLEKDAAEHTTLGGRVDGPVPKVGGGRRSIAAVAGPTASAIPLAITPIRPTAFASLP
jgi:hypothetical protein